MPPVAIALGYLALNDKEQVFAWLEQALAVRDVHLIDVPWDAKWETLRNDRRFRDLLTRSGLHADRAL